MNFASSSLSHGDFLTKISATDQDSKMNSEITYNISNKDAFNTDPTTGIISVKSFTFGKTRSSQSQTDAFSTPFTSKRWKSSTQNERPEKPSYTSEFTNPATDPGNIVHSMPASLAIGSLWAN